MNRNVEDFYPLSPMQQGMLFHSIAAPDSGVYVEQLGCTLAGDLDVPAFERAWQRVIDRHTILRTAFVGGALKEQVQVVQRQARVPIFRDDWSALSPDESRRKHGEFLRSDLKKGFDPAKAPLMRLALIRTGETTHRFLWSYHHVLLDGWSGPILMQEFFALYEAERAGRSLALPQVRPYRDYIVWLKKQDLAQAEAFWRGYLAGFAAPTPLVVDRPEAGGPLPGGDAEEDADYALADLWLPEATTEAVQELARRQQITLNTLVQGAWALLLSRYSGESDILFGATVSGRPPDLPGAESMLGLFINTLPVRVAVPPEAPVGEWLRGIQASSVEMRQYEYSPLVNVQGWSELPRGTALFESLLVYENYPVAEAMGEHEGSLEIRDILAVEQTNYPLTLVAGVSGTLGFKIGYDTRRFDAATIRRLLGHLRTLVEGMAAGPERPLAALPILTAEEEQQLLIDWNETGADFPADVPVHQLFEAQVERTPDGIALICAAETLTYRELNRRANQLAHFLRARGVGPETLVGICVERGAAMIVGALGILKAGGAYVPLDPSYPEERLAFMIEDASVPFLLTQAHLEDRLATNDERGPRGDRRESGGAGKTTNTADPSLVVGRSSFVVRLDSDWETIARESEANPASGAGAENLAYVIYTSGSTGRPKGTLLQHRGLCNLATVYIRDLEITAADHGLQFFSFGFDGSVADIFSMLLSGAALCIPSRETVMSPRDLHAFLRDNGVSIMLMPPSTLSLLSAEGLPDLRLVLSGGEACTPELVARWSQGRRFVNAYGPTEATVAVAWYHTDRLEDGVTRIPVGRPIANTQIYILDALGRPVPVGVPGELHVGGVGVARGYLNRPELTAEKFVVAPLPLSALGSRLSAGGAALPRVDSSRSDPTAESREPRAESRLYKTGDLARYRPDGSIEVLGRIDHQVKVRGFRIELGEIEQVLASHPGVQDAVVMAREDTPGAARLVGYVVPAASGAESRLELWPSVAEYFVYDDLLYYAMTHDERRNESYAKAAARLVKDKVVLDIGTGKDAILARMCVEAGAKKVYAIELLEETYRKALACIESLGLQEHIHLIHGDATKVELPEPVDVCISEIVGPIGGCEGAARILTDAHRLLKPGGRMIPERSITRIAAVTLPEEFVCQPAFSDLTADYVRKIFDQVGYSFDLRLSVKGATRNDLLSTVGVFEDLDFTGPTDPEYCREVSLDVTRDGRVDGFLVWLNLHTLQTGDADGPLPIDILDHEHCWLPVFLPVFSPGLDVADGDRIRATIHATLCENGLNPDYRVQGRIDRRSGPAIDFDFESPHFRQAYRQTPFYDRLFDGDTVPVRPASGSGLSARELRDHLKRRLPDYMVPAEVVTLDALPLSPNGKVDRRALPAPDARRVETTQTTVAPRDDLEQQLAQIWEEVLGVRGIGVTDDFFDLGGHSLLAVRVAAQVEQRMGRQIPIMALFQGRTIENLAREMRAREAGGAASALVTLREGGSGGRPVGSAARGSRRPVFFIHPSGGSVHWYTELAGLLGPDQPVYGIQCRGLSGEEPLHTEVEAMAAYYVEAIRSAQPEGPYQIVSWSLGVILAFEVARQFYARGEEVSRLVLLDQGPFLTTEAPIDDAAYLMSTFGAHLPLDEEKLRPLGREEQVAHVLAVGKEVRWIHPDVTLEQFRHFVAMLRTHSDAWRRYAPRPYAGRITLIRALEEEHPVQQRRLSALGSRLSAITEGISHAARVAGALLGREPRAGSRELERSDMGWGDFARGGVETHDVPGDHISMLTSPHVKVLARTLRDCFDDAA